MKPLSETLAWTIPGLVQPVRLHPGINFVLLWRDEHNREAAIVELEPDAHWQGVSTGATPLEMFIISGQVADDARSYPVGTFIHWPQTHRATLRTDTGCRMFVLQLGAEEAPTRDAG